MKSSRRALRRRHRQRMLKRALRSVVLSWPEDEDARRQRAVRWRDNLKKCSCWMCGNSRKFTGRATWREERDLQAASVRAVLENYGSE